VWRLRRTHDFVGDDEESYEIDTTDGGIKLHPAARVDEEAKHPLGATVTERKTHEMPQFEHLKDDVEVFNTSATLSQSYLVIMATSYSNTPSVTVILLYPSSARSSLNCWNQSRRFTS
jgi:hypothetical protein